MIVGHESWRGGQESLVGGGGCCPLPPAGYGPVCQYIVHLSQKDSSYAEFTPNSASIRVCASIWKNLISALS